MSTKLFPSLLIALIGCSTHREGATNAVGGGRDAVTIEMPFTTGYSSQCVQGVGGDYSHDYTSTYYDLDFDTPNDVNDFVYAPISGTAYVNESTTGFGTHVNIDMGDGTYIIIGHLSEAFITRGEEVAVGQIIGYEGTTGSSTGDHVHIGRHEGKAWEDATRGTSIDGLSIYVYDNAVGVERDLPVGDFVCDLYSGRTYTSRLATTLWHPNGTLVKTPDDARVYLLEQGKLRHIDNEEVFWSNNYSFDNLAIIDDTELACYGTGDDLTDETSIRAAYDDGTVWMLVGKPGRSGSYAKRVRSSDWSATLKSWGIIASSYYDLEDEGEIDSYTKESGYMTFRDGTIVKEASSSTVYFISDGVAMPIVDYDTFLLLDLFERELLQVSNGSVATIQGRVGDCTTGSYCLTSDGVTTCGGSDALSIAGTREDEDDDEPEEVEQDEPDDESETEPEQGGTGDGTARDGELPDDLGEGLSWIRVGGTELGLKIGEVFSRSVDGDDVAVTGVGVNSSWSYDTRYLVDYDASTDMGWYRFSNGWYRINLRTTGEWAMYWEDCLSSSNSSALCHENQDLSHALCFGVSDGVLYPLSNSECRSME